MFRAEGLRAGRLAGKHGVNGTDVQEHHGRIGFHL